MRYTFILSIGIILFSCNFNGTKRSGDDNLTTNELAIYPEKIAQIRLTNAVNYQEELEKFDQGDLTSLDLACMLFKNCMADSLTRDSMFVVFNDFYNILIGNYIENNESINNRLENSPSDETISQLKTQLDPYGILLCSTDGTFYLEPQTGYLLKNFGPGISSGYCEYLSLLNEEQKGGFALKGSTVLNNDSLTSRIIKWEKFLLRYPHFISIEMARMRYAHHMETFLAGSDSLKVFDPESDRLKDSAEILFESFISKNPQSASSEVVKEYLELLKSTNFSYTEKIDSFLFEKVYR
jgi:hypothetical protein